MTHNQLFTAQRYNIKNILIFLFFFKKNIVYDRKNQT